MKILSINISLPKKIIFNNEEVSTSIFKKPVNKKLKVQKSGIEGDMQADLKAHGGINKAVYAYSYTHYKYWGELLNNDFSNDYGLIGENLTVDDFNEKEFFIGDEFKISDAIFKITQPRIPCYKLSIKMNKKDFVEYFIDYNHLGMYMSVLKQGKIKKGDNFELTHRENNSMSVYEISKLIFDSNNNIEKIKKAVKLDYLSDEIKTRFNVKLAKLGHYETL